MSARRRRRLGAIETGFLVAAAVVATFAIAGAIGMARGEALAVADDRLTPGVARTDLNDAEIKATKWGKDARAVTPAMIRVVAERYGIKLTRTDPRGEHDPSCGKPRREIDHRIPRECGGADEPDNLSYQPAPYWHRKDLVENWAHRQVLAGAMTLAECQAAFRGDWRRLYRKIFGVDADQDPPAKDRGR